MGTREEGHAGVIIKGYSGKIRPWQLEGGACRVCREPVFVEEHDAIKMTVDRIEYVHLGCEAAR